MILWRGLQRAFLAFDREEIFPVRESDPVLVLVLVPGKEVSAGQVNGCDFETEVVHLDRDDYKEMTVLMYY